MSIRCDTSSLIAGSIVCGVPGLGILGSVILATTGDGGSGPGILFNDVEAGDENKEFRGLVTDFPDTGTFVINENGTFTFTGPSADSFQYQLYVDGVAVGSPATVSLYEEATEIDVAASGLASVTHTATGAVSADVLAFIEVAASGLASVTHGGVGGVSVHLIDPEAVTIEAACSGLAAVTHGATGAASVDLLNFIDVSAAGLASITHAATGSVSIGDMPSTVRGSLLGRSGMRYRYPSRTNVQTSRR